MTNVQQIWKSMCNLSKSKQMSVLYLFVLYVSHIKMGNQCFQFSAICYFNVKKSICLILYCDLILQFVGHSNHFSNMYSLF